MTGDEIVRRTNTIEIAIMIQNFINNQLSDIYNNMAGLLVLLAERILPRIGIVTVIY